MEVPSKINFGKYRLNLTKHEANKESDPNDRTNAAINLDPTDHNAIDSEVRKKRFFSFLISWITRITDPRVHTNRLLMFSYKPLSPSHTLPCLILGVGLISGLDWWNLSKFPKGAGCFYR